jgi:hypothetical protein
MQQTLAIRQTKFSNGEISPLMYGDTLHPKYLASLRTCKNWLPLPNGALLKRSGTKFVAPVKDSSYPPRLIQFIFSDAQTFVLEVGNLYVRFYQNSKYVGVDGNLHTYGDAYVGGYYEIVTTFTTAMLPHLKFSQVGDVITICYGGQVTGVAALAPQDLTHTNGALTPWAISVTPLKIPTAAVPTNVNLAFGAFSSAGGIFYNKGDRATTTAGGTTIEWVAIQDGITGAGQAPPNPPGTINAAGTGIQGNLYWTPAVDLSHLSAKLTYAVTAIVQDPNGVVYETGRSSGFVNNSPVGLDRLLPLNPPSGPPGLPAGWTVLYYKLYRTTNTNVFGWIADITGSSIFYDDGHAPDYTKQPPAGLDPFLANAVDSFPSVVGYLDQRRLWAASALLPQGIWLSEVGSLYRYDRPTPGKDTDSMFITIASEVSEQIRSFTPMRRGLVLTGQGEWAIAGQGGGPVSRSSLDIKRQSKWGSSWLNPIVIGTGLIFNTAKSNQVRDLYPLYGLYSDIWDGQDLTVLARHLMENHTITDWAFQSVPYPIVWATREDGTLLSMTYQHAPASFGQQLAEGVVAWAQHSTGSPADKVERICVVPEPPEDAVYMVVNRKTLSGGTIRNIERMTPLILPNIVITDQIITDPATGLLATRTVADVKRSIYCDATQTWDGMNKTATTMAVVDLGLGVYRVTSSGAGNWWPVPGGTGNSFSAAIDAGHNTIVFDPDGYAVTMKITGVTSGLVATCELITPLPPLWPGFGVPWGIGIDKVPYWTNPLIDTLGPTDPRGVVVLIDGNVSAPVAYGAGFITLPQAGVVVQVGLAYNADISLLDAWDPRQEIRNKFKNVLRIGFEVSGTRDMWGGKDFANLQQWKQRNVVDAYGVMGLATGYFEMFLLGGFTKTGQAALRHYQPLPAALTSVLREMTLADS